MDRLTQSGIIYNFAKLDIAEIRWLEEVQKRLAEYEDTGLTPEEIVKMSEVFRQNEDQKFCEVHRL